MKMKLIAVAVCATASMVAHAQSAVTLYGILDEGVNWTSNSNGAHQYNMTSGVASGSRWGLRGSEDLGGGLKAVFVLENGFDVGSGALGQGGENVRSPGVCGIVEQSAWRVDRWPSIRLRRRHARHL